MKNVDVAHVGFKMLCVNEYDEIYLQLLLLQSSYPVAMEPEDKLRADII
jgi:hypothetical protein